MDERFHRGIQEFNRRYFFEAHDILEDLWHDYRETDRSFLQGLIQVAVGFHHLEGGNYKGARSQLSKGIEKLEHYQPNHHGIELQEFLIKVKRCLKIAERLGQGEAVRLDEAPIPKLQYTQEFFAGRIVASDEDRKV